LAVLGALRNGAGLATIEKKGEMRAFAANGPKESIVYRARKRRARERMSATLFKPPSPANPAAGLVIFDLSSCGYGPTT
jgi:hypothetical protein